MQPAAHECFEYRERSRVAEYRVPEVPSEFAPAVAAMSAVLDRVGRKCLGALESALRLPKPGIFEQVIHGALCGFAAVRGSGDSILFLSHFPQVLDSPTLPDDLAHPSYTALRLLHYDKIGMLPEAEMQAYLGDHTDSTMVTVAPKASVDGLDLRPYSLDLPSPDYYMEAEQHLQPDDCIVFAGDCLARLTWNFYPALVRFPPHFGLHLSLALSLYFSFSR